ncbi:MAG: glycosyltransferase [Candidatus Woesearchaeota archaeon]
MNHDKPVISIVVATLNEEKHIGGLLESFASQSYPKDSFEILLYDGLSDDNTVSIASQYEDKINIRIFENTKRRQVYAFNMGLKDSIGEYYMILGAHSSIGSTFIEDHYASYKDISSKHDNVAGVGGIHLQKKENTLMSRMGYLFFSNPLSGASYSRFNKSSGFRDTISFGFYRKDVLLEVGGFDERLITGQDYEINARIRRKGYLLYQDSRLVSEYSIRPNIMMFLKQIYRYSMARGVFYRMGYYNVLWLVPVMLLLYEIMALASYFVYGTVILFYPMLLYLGILLAGGLYSVVMRRDILGLLLPILLFITHHISAVGFIKGLVFGSDSLGK